MCENCLIFFDLHKSSNVDSKCAVGRKMAGGTPAVVYKGRCATPPTANCDYRTRQNRCMATLNSFTARAAILYHHSHTKPSSQFIPFTKPPLFQGVGEVW